MTRDAAGKHLMAAGGLRAGKLPEMSNGANIDVYFGVFFEFNVVFHRICIIHQILKLKSI